MLVYTESAFKLDDSTGQSLADTHSDLQSSYDTLIGKNKFKVLHAVGDSITENVV
jgi:hypothetical protein